MGNPAARVGDTTSHGTPLSPGPGSANVLIGGMPAWRVGVDNHLCPLVNAGVPHVGGAVMVGSTTVFINNMPAARMNNQVLESGSGPNTIISGDFTVLIG